MARMFFLLGLVTIGIGLMVIGGCSSIRDTNVPLLRAAVDTDGDSITDGTALGDIDMAETTVGDFKGIVAPNYSNVSNAAMSASGSISTMQDIIENSAEL